MNSGTFFSIVHIFTPHGHTFTFRDVTVLTDNESVLVIQYKAMSDNNTKDGTFIKKNIIGYSFCHGEF